uniref:Uncharacterized protein n=1 Tax=viral metagenome TaxID=1070528 RepID=A0A6C0DP78_9ZZZZ
MQGLLDTKKEYIDIILDKFTVPICTYIYDIYKGCKNIQEFQNKMANIKNWNNNIINESYINITTSSKCKLLPKILREVIVINVMLKTNKINAKKIKTINVEDFIHKCLINTGLYCWKNAYLFSHKNLKPCEKQYHLNIVEKNIKKIIKLTIRDCTPYELFLNDDEPEVEEEESDEEVDEEEEEEEEVEEEEEDEDEGDVEEEEEEGEVEEEEEVVKQIIVNTDDMKIVDYESSSDIDISEKSITIDVADNDNKIINEEEVKNEIIEEKLNKNSIMAKTIIESSSSNEEDEDAETETEKQIKKQALFQESSSEDDETNYSSDIRTIKIKTNKNRYYS